MDRLIRDVDPDLAAEKVVFMWSDVKSKMQRNDASLTRTLYTDLMKYTGRRILSKLEEGEFSQEIWSSYCDFFANAILSYGTSEMRRLLIVAERVLNSVLAYPTQPVPLLKEYLATAIRQEEQRSKEIQRFLKRERDSALTAPPVDQLPELEPQNEFTSAIPSYPLELATRLLNDLPEHMTFAHSHCTLYLKLCNPLQIPACGFVGPGYACDTCHIRGLRAAYQAMLYDDAEEDERTPCGSSSRTSPTDASAPPFNGDATARPAAAREAVRSDAQIAKRTHHGFDMCVACAVYFFHVHRTHAARSLRAPFPPFEQGRAAGVRILCARRLERHRSIDHQFFLQLPTRVARTSDASTPVSPVSHSLSLSRPPSSLSHRASVASQRSHSTQTSPGSHAPLPLFRPRTPEKSWGFVHITCCIAPFGARPIAWVVTPDRATDASPARRTDNFLDDTLRLPSDWRAHLTVIPKRYAVFQDPLAFTVVAGLEDGDSVGTADVAMDDVGIAKAHAVAKMKAAKDPPGKPPGGAPAPIRAHAITAAEPSPAPPNDTCTICLNELGGSQPVIETTCHHWFHVDCILDYAAMAENTCPLCRCEHALPDMSREQALSVNEYCIHLRLSPEQMNAEKLTICVGALISRRNSFHNITNVGALCSVVLLKGQLKGFEVSS